MACAKAAAFPQRLAVLLVGSDMEGKVFSEHTRTVLLSRHGAGIVSEYKLAAEQELILRRLDSNKEAEVRVVGQLGSQTDSYTYGVAFLDSHVDFWGIEFPPATESEKLARRLLLQCSSCKCREVVEQSDLEADVYHVNAGIVRYCKKCGSSTVWKAAVGTVGEDLTLPATGQDPEPAASPAPTAPDPSPVPPPPARQENRRKHIRTKVSFKACVRSFAFGDDIVTCEDMSRGGLRFKSRRRYADKAAVEIAAPYSPGVPSIFVAAQIAYVLELSQESSSAAASPISKSPAATERSRSHASLPFHPLVTSAMPQPCSYIHAPWQSPPPHPRSAAFSRASPRAPR